MTIDDVRREIADINAIRDDDEAAHAAEDRLHQAVLLAIAKGDCVAPQEMARLALTTKDIAFSRWCT